jgi:hypothetical protein
MLYVVAIAFDALVDDCVPGVVVETTAGTRCVREGVEAPSPQWKII